MIRWVARTSGNGVRRSLPVVMRFAWEAVKQSCKLILLAQVNYWISAPATASRMANELVAKAAQEGFPPQLDNVIYQIGRVVGFLLLLVGFILNAYLTVWILNLLF